jgi:hypothetical protein
MYRTATVARVAAVCTAIGIEPDASVANMRFYVDIAVGRNHAKGIGDRAALLTAQSAVHRAIMVDNALDVIDRATRACREADIVFDVFDMETLIDYINIAIVGLANSPDQTYRDLLICARGYITDVQGIGGGYSQDFIGHRVEVQHYDETPQWGYVVSVQDFEDENDGRNPTLYTVRLDNGEYTEDC